jgi:hypothetical protein
MTAKEGLSLTKEAGCEGAESRREARSYILAIRLQKRRAISASPLLRVEDHLFDGFQQSATGLTTGGLVSPIGNSQGLRDQSPGKA